MKFALLIEMTNKLQGVGPVRIAKNDIAVHNAAARTSRMAGAPAEAVDA